jgi:hypothetical protein
MVAKIRMVGLSTLSKILRLILSSVLPQHVVQNAAEIIIKQFMPLNEAELNEWMSDPEQWVNDEDTDNNEQWVFEIRVSFVILAQWFVD